MRGASCSLWCVLFCSVSVLLECCFTCPQGPSAHKARRETKTSLHVFVLRRQRPLSRSSNDKSSPNKYEILRTSHFRPMLQPLQNCRTNNIVQKRNSQVPDVPEWHKKNRPATGTDFGVFIRCLFQYLCFPSLSTADLSPLNVPRRT